jgi:hypothetical protein
MSLFTQIAGHNEGDERREGRKAMNDRMQERMAFRGPVRSRKNSAHPAGVRVKGVTVLLLMGANSNGGLMNGIFDRRIFSVKNCPAYAKTIAKIMA